MAADLAGRKAILRERMVALPLFERLVWLCEASPDRQISIIEFFDYLREWFPREHFPELARTIIGWGRFAGLLVYSSVALGLPEKSTP